MVLSEEVVHIGATPCGTSLGQDGGRRGALGLSPMGSRLPTLGSCDRLTFVDCQMSQAQQGDFTFALSVSRSFNRPALRVYGRRSNPIKQAPTITVATADEIRLVFRSRVFGSAVHILLSQSFPVQLAVAGEIKETVTGRA